MQINLQAKNIQLSDELKDYILKRVTNLGKLLMKIEERGGEVSVNFEVSRNTNHHRGGEVFSASCGVVIDGEQFYVSRDAEDINSAVDEVKESLFRDLRRDKDRKQALFTRGARRIKNMMKGVGSFRPWRKR